MSALRNNGYGMRERGGGREKLGVTVVTHLPYLPTHPIYHPPHLPTHPIYPPTLSIHPPYLPTHPIYPPILSTHSLSTHLPYLPIHPIYTPTNQPTCDIANICNVSLVLVSCFVTLSVYNAPWWQQRAESRSALFVLIWIDSWQCAILL